MVVFHARNASTWSLLAIAAALTFSSTAKAQTSDQDARNHFDAGVSYFKTSEYEDALREFQRAYDLSAADKKPVLLLNIASVYERIGNLEKTIETLKQYLQERPDAPDKATIQLRIKNLEKRVKDKAADEKKAHEQQKAQEEQKAKEEAAATKREAPKEQPKQAPEPPDRIGAYVVLGAAGAAAIGAVVTGLMAQSSYNERKDGCGQTPEGCSDGDVSPVTTMAWVSTGLTGLAVVGAGVGTYMFFAASPSQPDQQHASGWTPQVNAGVAKDAVNLQAAWRF